MKVLFKKQDLLTELSILKGALAKKIDTPILNFLLLKVPDDDSGKATIAATDLELYVETTCRVTKIEPGVYTIPMAKLYDICRSVSEDTIAINSKAAANGSESIVVSADNSKFVFQTLPAKGFPAPPKPPTSVIAVNAMKLREMLYRTAVAVSDTDTKYGISGCLFSINSNEKDTLVIAGSDGNRLAVAGLSVGSVENSCDEIIPKKAIDELVTLLSKASIDDKVNISIASNHIFFKVGDRMLCTRKLSGIFPDFKPILDIKVDKCIVFDLSEFIKTTRLMSLANDSEQDYLKISIKENSVDVFAKDSSGTTMIYRTILAECKDLKGVDLFLNTRYLADMLSVVGGTKVKLIMEDGVKPVLCVPVDVNDIGYRHVIMPMRPTT